MKKYQKPEIEFTVLQSMDILTGSLEHSNYIGDIDPTAPDGGLTWGQI